MTDTTVPLLTRLWLCLACAVRILFDPRFAAQVAALRQPAPTLSSQPASAPDSVAVAPSTPVTEAARERAAAASGALRLLALLQREGRLLDFVQQDVAAFSDVDVGAAARLVHDGCRRALQAHAHVVSVRSEAEGASLTLERAREDVKLVGNVAGSAPYRGVLRHRGWRVEELTLPTVVGAYDEQVIAPAELELP